MPDKLVGTRFMVVVDINSMLFDRKLAMVKLVEDHEDMRRANTLYLVMKTPLATEFPIGSTFQIDITRKDEDTTDIGNLLF